MAAKVLARHDLSAPIGDSGGDVGQGVAVRPRDGNQSVVCVPAIRINRAEVALRGKSKSALGERAPTAAGIQSRLTSLSTIAGEDTAGGGGDGPGSGHVNTSPTPVYSGIERFHLCTS